ncbi:geminin coiled-coil domain-containing protein 1 [Brachyistius frenatus]|uniref:geminin coiled-coil domain-containing protein 1 n=1 Tax=Brachyistius frenatus TaxID=100188 RepID=UPI0037E6FD44
METLASIWALDPRDLREKRHEPAPAWESQCFFGASPPAGLTCTEQLSSNLQRNKQLQDTLLQREEELARLQEENNKLREFLTSSFVRSLEQKAKKLFTDGRRSLKRDQTYLHHEPGIQQVSKRVCRNLTGEFCCESSETAARSETNLDLWILRTLGLKDRDTIDTSTESSVDCLGGFVHDAAIPSSSSPKYSPLSSLGPPVATSSPVQRNQRSPDCRYGAQLTNCIHPAKSAQDHPDHFIATGPTRHHKAPEAEIRFNTSTSFQSDRAEVRLTAFSHVLSQAHADQHPSYWSPVHDSRTLSQDTTQFSPPAETLYLSPMSSSSPITNQTRTPVIGCSPTSPPAAPQPPAAPWTPRSQMDLAFSMSLSPSSSVKTHSFPQGQAFVRKDMEGRWNFTWVPRQGP